MTNTDYVHVYMCKAELHTLVTHQLTNHKSAGWMGSAIAWDKDQICTNHITFEKLTLKCIVSSLLASECVWLSLTLSLSLSLPFGFVFIYSIYSLKKWSQMNL